MEQLVINQFKLLPEPLQLEVLHYIQYLLSVKYQVTTSVLETEKVSGNPQNGKVSFFDKYNGSLKSRLSLQEIDARLHQLRQEWERDTW